VSRLPLRSLTAAASLLLALTATPALAAPPSPSSSPSATPKAGPSASPTSRPTTSPRPSSSSTATPAAGPSAQTAISSSSGGHYFAAAPVRIFDTRTAIGGHNYRLGAARTAEVMVSGQAGVPATASAVVVNATVTNISAPSYITLYPSGQAPLNASNLNFGPGMVRANLVTVALGSDGGIMVYNSQGQVDVILDLQGYYGPGSDLSGLYRSLSPARIADSRVPLGFSAALGPGQTFNLQVAGRGNVPASGASAGVLNITTTDATQWTYISAYPAGQSLPNASNVNVGPGQVVPNRVIARLGSAGQVAIYNSAGYVNVIVDVVGYFTDSSNSSDGGEFFAQAPQRILDTRTGNGAPQAQLQQSPLSLQVSGRGGVPSSGVGAVVLNLTETNPNQWSFTTVYPGGNQLPMASDLNYGPGMTFANLDLARLGPSGTLQLFNRNGGVDEIADIAGWFTAAPAPSALPANPATVSAALSGNTALVSWTAPASNGGSQITSYTIVSSAGQMAGLPGTQTTLSVPNLVGGRVYTFTIYATNAAGSGPGTTSNPVTVTSNTIGDVTYYSQTHRLSCEAAALEMALSHEGIYPSQDDILSRMHPDYTSAWWDSWGNMHWTDPYSNFVGDPDGWETYYTGYGTYYPVVSSVAQSYGAQVLRAGEGVSPSDVYGAVLSGHPVVTWVGFQGTSYVTQSPSSYQASDGRWVMFGHGFEHAVTVVGVNVSSVLIYNPWSTAGPGWISKSEFESYYSDFDQMAVILA
jgi:uncharacterized protein YvpB